MEYVARAVQDELEAGLGQPLVIDYRPGQGGMQAAAELARAAADGHTLLLSNAAPLVIAPALASPPPFDLAAQFTPVAQVVETVFVVTVRAGHPAATLAEFVDAARGAAEPWRYASGGRGTSAHLNGELFNQAAGLALEHAPLPGSTQGLADLIAGRVQLTIDAAPTVLPEIRRGRLRALAVTAPVRSALLPGVPTVREEGWPGLEVLGFQGLLGPAGLPRAVVDRLSAELARVLAQPAVRRRLADGGHEPRLREPRAFAALLQAEAARWAAFVRARGLRG